MPSTHAFLSASSSSRWIKCPPSAKLNAEVEDMSSTYAEQGTEAHALCEHLLLKALGRITEDPTPMLAYYDTDMQSYTEGYRDFVMEQIEEAKLNCADPFVSVEQLLNFSRWVPDGFGTGDCIIINDGVLHIIDFKYGMGVQVSASHNSQLMCYALGAYDTFESLYPIERIKMTIYQPRLSNVDSDEMDLTDLLQWANNTLAPRAKQAILGEGDFTPGDHCQFCKVKCRCRARALFFLELGSKNEFKEPALMTDAEIEVVLHRTHCLISWAKDIDEYTLNQALAGKHYEGFKLVEGRSTRKFSNEEKVAETVQNAGFDPYEKKLKGITALTSELGKTLFTKLLGGLIIKPQGKPVLVEVTDKRPELTNAANEFDDEESSTTVAGTKASSTNATSRTKAKGTRPAKASIDNESTTDNEEEN